MIKLPDGELRDYLPVTMKNDVDMVCLSYAIKKATERLFRYNHAAMTFHFIDSAPEPILDLLAVELRSLYYLDTLPVEKKREIVKNTLRWHSQAGTPGAMAEMVKVVFGEGEVVEWPDFSEPPYTPGTFDIVTNAQLTPDILEYFISVIDRVKNVRSHLRRVVIKRTVEVVPRVCPHTICAPKQIITNNKKGKQLYTKFSQGISAAVFSIPIISVMNSPGECKGISISASESHRAAAESYPNIGAVNGKMPVSRCIKSCVPIGVEVQSIPHLKT